MDIKEAAIKRFAEPLRGFLVEDILAGAIKEKLDEVVADTSNPYDNAMVDLLYPMLQKAVADKLDELVAGLKD